MSLFETIGRHITNAGQDVVQKTQNLSDVAKLNSIISEKEKKAKQCYMELGEIYYGQHKDDMDSENYAYIEKLNTLLSEIESCKEELNTIKGVARCPRCGMSVTTEAIFCQRCGEKL